MNIRFQETGAGGGSARGEGHFGRPPADARTPVGPRWPWIFCLLALLFWGCAPSPPKERFPGASLTNRASPDLRRDVYRLLIASERAAVPKTRSVNVVQTTLVSTSDNLHVDGSKEFLKGRWVERWTVERGGSQVHYRVEFNARGERGTRIIAIEEKVLPAP